MTQPTPTLLIGLAAPAGAGKDTVGGYLEDQYSFCALGFADPLRDMLGALLQNIDVDGAWMVERSLKEERMAVIGRSYRELAQSLGTEWGRHTVRQDLWVRIAAHRVAQIHALGSNAVLTDVRYQNEADWITAQGGTLVRIYREDAQPVRLHSSEQLLHCIECDHELHNNGSKATLFEQVDRILEQLRQEP
jgi:hypothetical protein